jgi:chemotaxis methyl-accepting protein methylase
VRRTEPKQFRLHFFAAFLVFFGRLFLLCREEKIHIHFLLQDDNDGRKRAETRTPKVNGREMQENGKGLTPILQLLMATRGFDFSGYHPAMLERRIGQRLPKVPCRDFAEYYAFLRDSPDEIDHLIDSITINVSRFFRNPLTFELLAEKILPAIVQEKVRKGGDSLRIWSAGCAMGEEPYSLAILLDELLEKEAMAMHVHIFATDIDTRILAAAAEGVFQEDQLAEVKYRLHGKYFSREGSGFRLLSRIREKVNFSFYDMLDKKHRVPPASIFGNFDLILCRNLLIYFKAPCQETIFAKLHHALAEDGYLVLGEAEAPYPPYQRYFGRMFDYSSIYRKE